MRDSTIPPFKNNSLKNLKVFFTPLSRCPKRSKIVFSNVLKEVSHMPRKMRKTIVYIMIATMALGTILAGVSL